MCVIELPFKLPPLWALAAPRLAPLVPHLGRACTAVAASSHGFPGLRLESLVGTIRGLIRYTLYRHTGNTSSEVP